MLRKFAETRKLSYNQLIIVKTRTGEKTFQCALCLDELSRQLGLMGQQLTGGQGAFFDFDSMKELALWMKNCICDLDAIFIDEEGKVIHKASMKCSEPNVVHRCPYAARYVLEILPSESSSINVGDQVSYG